MSGEHFHIFNKATGIFVCGCGHVPDRNATPLARNTDARTSHAAAARMAGSLRQGSLKALAYGALFEHGPLTSGEIADSVAMQHEKIWRRVSDLKNDGIIYPDGERMWHGTAQQVWHIR